MTFKQNINQLTTMEFTEELESALNYLDRFINNHDDHEAFNYLLDLTSNEDIPMEIYYEMALHIHTNWEHKMNDKNFTMLRILLDAIRLLSQLEE